MKRYNIALIGFMGTGKSTVGAALAKAQHMQLVDTDTLIEERTGLSVQEIFARQGETPFRNYESQAIAACEGMTDTVFATGGGAVMRAQNVESLKKHSRLVWLTASPETILARLSGDASRPLLQGKTAQDTAALLHRRNGFYRRAADLVIATDGKSPEKIAEEILSQLSS